MTTYGSTDGDDQGSDDPFEGENMEAINFIQLSRIYDVLLAILTETNADVASDLMEAHLNGLLIGPTPYFVGKFMTNEENAE